MYTHLAIVASLFVGKSAKYLAYKKYYLLALVNKGIKIFTNTNINFDRN